MPSASAGLQPRTDSLGEPDPAHKVDPRLMVHLLSIGKSMRALAGHVLRDIDVANGQDDFLLMLGERGRMSTSELADAIGVRSSTVSKTASRLFERGLIERWPSRNDARVVMLSLTQDGSRLRTRVANVHAMIEAELKRALGVDVSDAGDLLNQLDEVLARRLRRLR